MKVASFLFIVLSCFVIGNHGYSGTVVEYNAVTDQVDTVLRNTQRYLEIIDKDTSDIIVFPEYGLTTISVLKTAEDLNKYAVPLPKDIFNKDICESENLQIAKVIRDISCAAERKRKYVVINIVETDTVKAPRKPTFYNTNIVFNREGHIIQTYRKINLYNELLLTEGKDLATFETDFGVTFGLMTCYDILFAFPATEMLKQRRDITSVIIPMAWSSVTPFLTSLSVQAGYAKKNKVNLLAANLNDPRKGNGGSGIYDANGVLVEQYISSEAKTQTVQKTDIPNTIAEVNDCLSAASGPTERTLGKVAPNIDGYVRNKGDLGRYKITPLARNEVDIREVQHCDGNFCCTFNAKLIDSLGEDGANYMWAVNNGKNASTCALIQCVSKDIASCGEGIPVNSISATFSSLSIKGKFRKNQMTIPITNRLSMLPITGYTFCETGEEITMSLADRYQNLTAFAIYGHDDPKYSSSTTVIGSAAVLITGVLMSVIFK